MWRFAQLKTQLHSSHRFPVNDLVGRCVGSLILYTCISLIFLFALSINLIIYFYPISRLHDMDDNWLSVASGVTFSDSILRLERTQIITGGLDVSFYNRIFSIYKLDILLIYCWFFASLFIDSCMIIFWLLFIRRSISWAFY